MDHDTLQKWYEAKQTTEVVFPTEKCTDGCKGKFGFCCAHQEARKDNNNNIVIDGPMRYPLLIITTNYNPYVRLNEWENEQGATLSRGHRSVSFTYGKHHCRHQSAHAIEVGHNHGEELFGFRTWCYVAGFGGKVYRY